jgi:two-component system chemotaxis response regulator CheY
VHGERTVLVVDDEADLRETLRDVFTDEGFGVRLASNGREALDLLKQGVVRPCVVILDLMMPVLDGNAVYAAMKADPQLAGIPVVVQTSDPSRAPVGVLVMRKPIRLDALLQVVERNCRCSGH